MNALISNQSVSFSACLRRVALFAVLLCWCFACVLPATAWQDDVPALIAQLHDGHAAVRRQAAEQLGGWADARAARPLIDLLHDHDPMVRQAAVFALSLTPDPRVIVGALTNVARGKHNGLVRG